jgi:hypothetical protein
LLFLHRTDGLVVRILLATFSYGFKIPEKLIKWTHNYLKDKDVRYEPIPSPSQEKPHISRVKEYWTFAALTLWQLSVNFGYQAVLQSFPTHPVVDTNHLLIGSAAFPPLALVSVVIGYFGDKLNKKQTNTTFKVLAFIGCLVFIAPTVAMKHYLDDYVLLMVRTCLQLFAINVVGCASLVLFLKYVARERMLSLVLTKSLLGVLGNIIPTIVDVTLPDTWKHFWTLEIVTSVLLSVSVIVLLLATLSPDLQIQTDLLNAAISLQHDTEVKLTNQHRRAAIVLSAFFFFEFALAPMQFEMVSYFKQTTPNGVY